MSNSIVTTARLVIRKIEDGDRNLISHLAQESPEYEFFSTYPKIDMRDSLCDFFWEEANRSDLYYGMIFLKDSGEFIGEVSMQHIDQPLPELGVELLSAYQNQGYGPEAMIAFCNWYSETYGLREVKARIRDENAHSIHVVEKLGGKYDAFTPFFPKKMLDVLKEQVPTADLSEFKQNSVREYLLQLPIL